MWEKKDASGGINDYRETHAWSTAPWRMQALNGQSDDGTSVVGAFAGHADWRLPSVVELQKILQHPYYCHETEPCVDPVFSNGVDSFTAGSFYWSSTSANPGHAWAVHFASGDVAAGDTGNAFHVRMVRGGRIGMH